MLQLVIYLFNYFIFSFKGSVVWLKSLLCLASLQILSGTKWMEAVSVDRHTIKPKELLFVLLSRWALVLRFPPFPPFSPPFPPPPPSLLFLLLSLVTLLLLLLQYSLYNNLIFHLY